MTSTKNSLKRFFPSAESSNRKKEIKQKMKYYLMNHYGQSKTVDGKIFPEIIDKEKLLEEWSSAKHYLQSFSERAYNFAEM